MKRNLLISLLCLLIISCNKNVMVNKDNIYVSDLKSIYKVNPKTMEKVVIIENDILYQINFNKQRDTLISVHKDSENPGILEISENGISFFPIHSMLPHYIYPYGRYVVLDNSQIMYDSSGEVISEFGIYDIEKKKLLKKFKVYGNCRSFRSITGYKGFAYVTTFDSEKNKSNLYEIDIQKLSIRKIFRSPQRRAPKIFFDNTANSYAFYDHWDFGPANEIAKIDLKTGTKKLIAQLDPYAYHMAIIEDLAVIIHYDEMNMQVDIQKPISILNLKTGKLEKLQILNIRPTDIISYQNNQVVITDEHGKMIIIDPKKKKVERFSISNNLFFLASPSESEDR
jgi:hypothetical protein